MTAHGGVTVTPGPNGACPGAPAAGNAPELRRFPVPSTNGRSR